MGARSKPAKKTAEKAAEIVATLPAKRADAEIAADVKRLVDELTVVMNEAERVGIGVNFNIGKVNDQFVSTLTMTKTM